jgi:hypothetical protein
VQPEIGVMAEETPNSGSIKDVESMPGEGLATTYTNYFYGHVGPEITRITFGEWVVGAQGPTYNVSVAMTHENAKLLIGLISRLITENEQRVSPSSPSAPSAQKDG